MTGSIRWDWKTLRFVERCQVKQFLYVDHVAIMPDGTLDPEYVYSAYVIEKTCSLWRVIQVVTGVKQ